MALAKAGVRRLVLPGHVKVEPAPDGEESIMYDAVDGVWNGKPENSQLVRLPSRRRSARMLTQEEHRVAGNVWPPDLEIRVVFHRDHLERLVDIHVCRLYRIKVRVVVDEVGAQLECAV